jgi:hypothetical protein
VLEEMPAFPERESSILAVLKKKKPGRVPENEIREGKSPAPITNHQTDQPQTQVMTTLGIVYDTFFLKCYVYSNSFCESPFINICASCTLCSRFLFFLWNHVVH